MIFALRLFLKPFFCSPLPLPSLLGDRCEQKRSEHDGSQDRGSHEEVRAHVVGSPGPSSPRPTQRE